MLDSTQAIVLYYTKYNDSSVVLHLFTAQHGRLAVMVHGIKSKKQNKCASFQSLFLLDTIIDFKPNRNIQTLKEFKVTPPLYQLSSDISKTTIALFIAEVLSKCLREENAEKHLFEFIQTSILLLNELDKGISVFHLAFLLKLSWFLGFSPYVETGVVKYYDVKRSKPVLDKPAHDFFLSGTDYHKMIDLLELPLGKLPELVMTKSERNSLLNAIIQMYEIHAINFSGFKSHQVLHDVFNH